MGLIRRLFCDGGSSDKIEKKMVGAKLNLRVDTVNQERYNPSFSVAATITGFVPSKEETQTTEETKCCEAVEDKDEVMGEKPTVKMNYMESKKIKFKYMDLFSDLAFRVLLIDDKIGPNDGKKDGKNNQELACREKKFNDIKDNYTIEVKQCDTCLQNTECKLNTIKQLMTYRPENAPEVDIFHYWEQNDIKTYYCPTVIKDFIDDDTIHFSTNSDIYPKRINVFTDNRNKKGSELNINCVFAPDFEEIDNNGTKEIMLNVQIIGVRDVRTALLLMSKFKFDMIFCDYLLDHKDENNDKREYAKQLLTFLSHEYKDEINNEPRETLERKRLSVLNQLRCDVLDNRGPLDKLWIMPVTGFNQTFINDLYRNNFNLIDYKWNISNGADPINTPWQFLYHLNKFIELQLKSSVYKKRKLMTFLQYTGEDLEVYLTNGNGERPCFEEFQQFMGADYANFMKRYGARKLIERDAAADGDNSNKSMFATYINKKFYNEPKYYIETELNQLMQHFYHQAATMFDERYGRQRLREAFERMRVFVAYNKLENEIPDTEKGKLIRGLRFIHTVIDSEFNREIIYNWIKENPKTE